MRKSANLEFMDQLESAVLERPSMPAIVTTLAIMAFVIFLMIWMAFTKVEEIARGHGQVVPTQDIQIIQSLEGGILQEILIAEGDRVKKGQVLLRISDIQFSSEEKGTEAKSLGLRAKKARLTAEAEGKELKMPEDILKKAPQIAENEKSLFLSRRKELETAFSILDERINKASADLEEVKAEIARLQSNRNLLAQEYEITRAMVAKKAAAKIDQIRLERELADIKGQISARAQEKIGLEADLKSTQEERKNQNDKFRSGTLTELNDVQTQISSLDESLKSISDRVDRTELRAPVDGLVNHIKIKTIGGVIEPAMRLVEIVPLSKELKIVATVLPTDIAFLKLGQPVKVKISAYDPQLYGSLEGKLVRIAANSTLDKDGNILFEIEVKTEKNHLGTEKNPLPITPGMVAEINIITGKRTIMHYLLKPFYRTADRALRER